MSKDTTDSKKIEMSLDSIDVWLFSVVDKIVSHSKDGGEISFDTVKTILLMRDHLLDRQGKMQTVGTLREVAHALHKSERMVSYYKAQGMPVTEKGNYNLVAIRSWLKNREPKKNMVPARSWRRRFQKVLGKI